MEKKNEKYMIETIMEQNRHQFIYGYNIDERTAFLKRMSDNYPIKIDTDSPMAIYLSNFELPRIDGPRVRDAKVARICCEYFDFYVIYNILIKMKKEIGERTIEKRIKPLLSYANRIKNSKSYCISTFDELIDSVRKSANFYLTYYYDYCTYHKSLDTDTLTIPFVDLTNFIKEIKEALNNSANFALVIDKQTNMTPYLTKHINALITSRINKDIAIKVADEPNTWQVYTDPNGRYIENIHDYGTVEFDDSYETYTKKLIERRKI